MRTLLAAAVLASVTLTSCQHEERAPAVAAEPVAVTHDFGTIPHGEERTVVLDLPLPGDDGPWIPLAFQRSCTCAKHRFLVVGPDGGDRIVHGVGLPDADDAVPDGGKLRMQLTIDTLDKEAADLEPVWTAGAVVLQKVGSSGIRRTIPLRFRFGIDSPVTVTPVAHLDVGDVPRPIRFRQDLEIRGDDGPLELQRPRVLEPAPGGGLREATDVHASVTEHEGHWRLSVIVEPAESRPDGPFKVDVLVPTDPEGDYVLRLPVSGAVVPALQVSPPGWIPFGPFPFDQPRTGTVLITDHDTERQPTFHVVGIVDKDGADLSDHFEAGLTPVAEDVRCHSLELRYRGTLETRSFRGEVLLAKEPDGEPILRIPFAGFAR